MTSPDTAPDVVGFDASLGRPARRGTWEELSRGTFRVAADAFGARRYQDAAALLEVSVLEAEELLDVYERWPRDTAEWIRAQGVGEDRLAAELERLESVIGDRAMAGIEAEWDDFTGAVASAAGLCRSASPDAVAGIETAQAVWLGIHDRAVDRVAGLVDVAVRLVGERQLGSLWDHLMADWHRAHQRRYALDHQDWTESARQLMTAIVDGFHAHLTGPDRTGDIEVIREPDRIGFRFGPCGSGGRTLATGITDGSPRSAPPFGFAVTTEEHDWAWNTVGICSYCVHCCQLNVLGPIDALGYPTRVIDPPVWPAETANPSCTWWVYRDPSLVPAAVYEQVGRQAPASTPTTQGRPAR
jgi:hypothetical protein